MITCYLQGGLGAQMHQIATALNLAWENDDEAIFSEEAHHLPRQGNYVSMYKDNVFRDVKFDSDLKVECFHKERFHTYSKIEYKENMCLKGFYQCEKYFDENREEILNLFGPSESKKSELLDRYPEIQGQACLHVRRGDCLPVTDVHPICPMKYYQKASERVTEGIDWYIFSDDIDWCEGRFDYLGDVTYMEGNKDYEDIYLMSFCDFIVTANSSFSWWGAQLSSSEKIITPHSSMWFGPKGPSHHNIVPERWEEINV